MAMKVKLQRAYQAPEERDSRLEQMRVSEAASRTAENKEDWEDRLEQMRIAAAVSMVMENEK